jgi:hypothetical protein
MKNKTISERKCLRCGHEWYPKVPGTPLRCGKCKTPYWDTPPTNEFAGMRNKAILLVQREKYAGRLPVLSQVTTACVDCGKRAVYYEHRDYKQPLNVVPVCASCNCKRGKAEC